MFDARLAFALVATLGLAAPALAQDNGQPLRDLDANRINPYQILIDFEFDGGACDAIGRAEVGELVDGTLAVNFPVSSTAEVCTMQIVEHEVKYAIDTEDDTITRIDVTATAADGRVVGTGSTDVERD
ncbi:hypothetical protein JP75_13670 [Devosia riboflavina]|uniref:Uncharacterized protein n=1 Tax=Devosia riboflavina TaxID=46914 RepID=A0A087M0Y7_9HYPH|nr:hypothetical protein [Devosia riboflavina]KFL30540.1 hypothetical protein JP75_13670 [Devosia riboflavina]